MIQDAQPVLWLGPFYFGPHVRWATFHITQWMGRSSLPKCGSTVLPKFKQVLQALGFFLSSRKYTKERVSHSVVSDSFDPLDCSPPGSSVHGILQARILQWVAIPFSRGSSQPRDWTQDSCITGRCFIIWTTREAPKELHAAAAKSLQSCPTLCNPRDSSQPGSSVPGILQAGALEWVAISFSIVPSYFLFFRRNIQTTFKNLLMQTLESFPSHPLESTYLMRHPEDLPPFSHLIQLPWHHWDKELMSGSGRCPNDLGHFAAAMLLQSCPTLCDPTDCSLPGSSIHWIFQARVLEWGVIRSL